MGRRRSNQKMQREYERAEQKFLCKRTGHVIAPSDPTAQAFIQVSPCDPASPSGFNDALLEKRPSEKKGSE